MAVSDGETITVLKDMGLVTNVFDEASLACLGGHLAIGHTRYSTAGPSTWHSAQPVYRPVGKAGFALGHNGNLTNTDVLADEVGMLPGMIASDSDLVAELIFKRYEARGAEASLEQVLIEVLDSLEGGFSFVLMDSGSLIGVRDPNGLRPLCLGQLPTGWVLASESPAVEVIGARFVRELLPIRLTVHWNAQRTAHSFVRSKSVYLLGGPPVPHPNVGEG